MAEWERKKQFKLTEKGKRWVDKCGRKDFKITKITKDTCICSLHFVGENSPNEENPDI